VGPEVGGGVREFDVRAGGRDAEGLFDAGAEGGGERGGLLRGERADALELDEARGLGRAGERHRRVGDERRHHVALGFAQGFRDEGREVGEKRRARFFGSAGGRDDSAEWHLGSPSS